MLQKAIPSSHTADATASSDRRSLFDDCYLRDGRTSSD